MNMVVRVYIECHGAGERDRPESAATAARRRHAQVRSEVKTLLSVGQPTACERVRCDAVDCREPKDRIQPWICCDVYGRWLHFTCCNLVKKPRVRLRNLQGTVRLRLTLDDLWRLHDCLNLLFVCLLNVHCI